MRHASVIFAMTVSCLGNVFANASARAEVFQFRFSNQAYGTFTTGAAASDPGYELITGLTFDVLSGQPSFPFAFSNVTGSHFQAGAAFNPTTGAFINHLAGGTYNNIGSFELDISPDVVSIDGSSFSQPSSSLTGEVDTINGTSSFELPGQLTITRIGAPAPEPSTWVMLLLGFAGLGFARYRCTKADGATLRVASKAGFLRTPKV